MSDEREDTTVYMALVNDDDQYSIWPADREPPLGWRDTGTQGPRAEVLAWIEQVWSDMRSPAIREKMEAAAGDEAEGHPS